VQAEGCRSAEPPADGSHADQRCDWTDRQSELSTSRVPISIPPRIDHDRHVANGLILILCRPIVATTQPREVLSPANVNHHAHVFTASLRPSRKPCMGPSLPIPAWMVRTANPRGPASGFFWRRMRRGSMDGGF